MSLRPHMKEQAPEERIKNFNEVNQGYTEEQAVKEAKRCIQCKKPLCVGGCPVGIDIPAFIKLIAEGKFKEASDKLKETNSLPAICGRVCPQETQCEKECILGKKKEPIAIGHLERFAADWGVNSGQLTVDSRGQPDGCPGRKAKVAIVGSGPAGLTAAGELAKKGYQVTIFEALHDVGGVLTYGIPEFRLPKDIVHREVEYVKSLGVEIKLNHLIGRTFTIKDLFDEGFKAIFVGTGAGAPAFLGICGENFNGVFSANEFLTRINLMKAYKFPEFLTPVKVGKKVAVIGAGNVAMDAARCARRLGADVTIVYRRSRVEMPARIEEIKHGEEEGIEFKLLTNPVTILGDDNGWVKGLECLRQELGEPDSSGRRRPVPIKGSNFIINVDTVVVAIGTSPNPLIRQTTQGLEINKWGGVVVDEKTGATSIAGLFAGGDVVTGSATVIAAMGAAKAAARGIHEYLTSTSP